MAHSLWQFQILGTLFGHLWQFDCSSRVNSEFDKICSNRCSQITFQNDVDAPRAFLSFQSGGDVPRAFSNQNPASSKINSFPPRIYRGIDVPWAFLINIEYRLYHIRLPKGMHPLPISHPYPLFCLFFDKWSKNLAFQLNTFGFIL